MKQNTVEPRLTNTLLKRTPLLNERFWPVPDSFPVSGRPMKPHYERTTPLDRTPTPGPKGVR